MRYLKHRHLMSCSVLFILLLYIFPRLNSSVRTVIYLIASLAILTVALLKRKDTVIRLQAVCLMISLLLSGALGAYAFSYKLGSVQEQIGSSREMTVTVTDIQLSLPYLSRLYVEWEAGGALLTCEYAVYADVGDTLSGIFYFEDFSSDINGYPEKEYNLAKGNLVHLYSYEDNLTREKGEPSLYTYCYNTRKSIKSNLSFLLSNDTSAYLSCLLLGERREMPDAVTGDFTELGLSHLLAISGMHLSVLFGGLLLLLRFLGIPKTVRNLSGIVSIWIFAAITGFPSSLVRAGLATSIVLCCHFISKRPDNATALCFAVAIIYAIDPYSVYDTGLTLSYMATLGILTVYPLFKKKLADVKGIPTPIKYIADALVIATVALMFTMPVSLTTFSSFTFLSLITTMIFSPLITIALYLSLMVLALGNIPILGEVVCTATELVTRLTFRCAALPAENLRLTVSTTYTFAELLTIGFCIAFFLLLLIAPRRWWIYLMPFCIFTASIYPAVAIYNKANENTLMIAVSEVKRNDIISLTMGGKTTILDISGGTASPSQTGIYNAKSEQHAVYIENYILLNRTYRTVTFTERLLNSNRINDLYLPIDILTDSEYEDICEAAKLRGTEVHTYSFTDTLSLNGIDITPNEPVYIERSQMPIHNILIETKDESIFYAGAAFSESSLALPDAEYIIAGSYGPLYKENFSFDECEVLVSKTAESFYLGEAAVYEKVTNVILYND